MRIAPIDIAHKSFNRKVMGLDPDEVAHFLRDVADQLEEVIRERNSLKETVRQKEIQLVEYKERDESLRATLATATKMADQIRQDAEREAQLILQDAAQKAEFVMRDGRDQLKRLYSEIADIKRLRMQFEANLKAVCNSHLSMIDSSSIALPDPQINLSHATTAPVSTANSMVAPSSMSASSGGAGAASHSANSTSVGHSAPVASQHQAQTHHLNQNHQPTMGR